MTKAEAVLWVTAIDAASYDLRFEGDEEGSAFLDEWAFLIEEFIYDMPIQRKPY